MATAFAEVIPQRSSGVTYNVADSSAAFPLENENSENRGNSSSNENENDNRQNIDPIAFCKSQVALNTAYKQRRIDYHLKTPLSARMVTGKNLKNLRPLPVRTAEFC